MSQIERIEGYNHTLRLWSDATYEVSTIAIKNLLNLVTQRLEIQLEIDARYYHFNRNWRVRFRYLGRQNFEQNLDASEVACANAVLLERLARYISDRIRRAIPNDVNQNWVIVRHRDGYFAIPCDTEAIRRSADTIGDRTCKYNALSRMLRCAVNPCGPCEGCTHYEKL